LLAKPVSVAWKSSAGADRSQERHDHTKAGDQLKQVAAKSNIELPTEVEAKGKALIDSEVRKRVPPVTFTVHL